MTKFLCKAFFNSHTHYRVVHTEGIDNPDQRISQDVNNFVITSTKLILKLTSTVFSTVAFGGAPHLQLSPAIRLPWESMVCVTSQSFSPTQHGTVATFTDSSGVAGVLWSISRNLVGVIIVYTSIGTWLTASVFGRRLAAHHALPFFSSHSSFPFNFVHAYQLISVMFVYSSAVLPHT